MKGFRIGKFLVLIAVVSGSYSTFMQNGQLDVQLSYDKQVYASLEAGQQTLVASR